jgi:hypothetical protein
MVLPTLALIYMLGEKQNMSYRHIPKCALTFHSSLFIPGVFTGWLDGPNCQHGVKSAAVIFVGMY